MNDSRALVLADWRSGRRVGGLDGPGAESGAGFKGVREAVEGPGADSEAGFKGVREAVEGPGVDSEAGFKVCERQWKGRV